MQRIVPNKDSMLMAFQGKIYELFIGKLDFTNEQTLLDSWQAELSDKQSWHYLKYLIGGVNSDVMAEN